MDRTERSLEFIHFFFFSFSQARRAFPRHPLVEFNKKAELRKDADEATKPDVCSLTSRHSSRQLQKHSAYDMNVME